MIFGVLLGFGYCWPWGSSSCPVKTDLSDSLLLAWRHSTRPSHFVWGTPSPSTCLNMLSADGMLRGEKVPPTGATATRTVSSLIFLSRLIRKMLGWERVVLGHRSIRPIGRRGGEWRRRAKTRVRVRYAHERPQNPSRKHS